MLSAKLTVVGGDARAAEISLKLPTTIGRGRDVTLTLPHPLVSRRHCEIFERDGALFVRDLKSLNGTYVDSQRIDGTARILPEQLLTIGTVTFRAQYCMSESGLSATDSNGHGSAGESRVLEMQGAVPSASDKDDGHSPSIRDRKTTPGKRVAAQARPARETVRIDKTLRAGLPAASSGIFEETPATGATPGNSVCEAMRESGASPGKKIAPASLGEIRSLLPGVTPAAMASGIDGLEVDAGHPVLDETDFSGIEIEQTLRARVEANDSALGSFIRKMPR